MTGAFKLKALRAVTIGARRLVAGAEVQADARTAREMIESAAARLADDADLPRLIQAVGARRPEPVTR